MIPRLSPSRALSVLLAALLLCQPAFAVAAPSTTTQTRTPDDWPGTRDDARSIGPGEWNGTFANGTDRDVLRLPVGDGDRVSLSLVTDGARSPSLFVYWEGDDAERNLSEDGVTSLNATGAVVNRTVTAPGDGNLSIVLAADDPSLDATWSLTVTTEVTTATTEATTESGTTMATVMTTDSVATDVLTTAVASTVAATIRSSGMTDVTSNAAEPGTSTGGTGTTDEESTVASTADTTVATAADPTTSTSTSTSTTTMTRTATRTSTSTGARTATSTTSSTPTSTTTTTGTPTRTTTTGTPTTTATTTTTTTATPTATPTTSQGSGGAPETSTYSYETSDSFMVRQGEQCIPVTPLSGDVEAKGFYDYRNPYNSFGTDYSYSSHMPKRLTKERSSRLFVYDGPVGVSLVMIHNERGANTDGAATFTFDGLPDEGEWVVVDDTYPGQDDQVSRTRVDWTWRGDRSDGGVFRGIARRDLNVTIHPSFGEGAALYGSSDRSGHVTEWQVLSGDSSDPDVIDLHSKSQPVTVSTGTCGGVGANASDDANAAPSGDDASESGGNGGDSAGAGSAGDDSGDADRSDSSSDSAEPADNGGSDDTKGSRAAAESGQKADSSNADEPAADGTRRAADAAGNAATQSAKDDPEDAAIETEIEGAGDGTSGSPLNLGGGSIILVIVGMLIGVVAVLYAVYGYS